MKQGRPLFQARRDFHLTLVSFFSNLNLTLEHTERGTELQTWKLTLEYEGTRYSGWQEQRNARTVAGELRKAAEEFFGAPVDVAGAGRTDAGVHALAQVARLRVRKKARAEELLREINQRLPSDINLLQANEASDRFDPRRDAKLRFYLYQLSARRSAFAKRFVWWVRDRLDLDSINLASGALVGRNDFAAFCDKRADDRSTIVVVEQAQIGVYGDLILFRIGASHFLWKMVRRIVGSLVEVGRGAISVSDFTGLLAGASAAGVKSYQVAEHTAPPSGLFLERVAYKKADYPRDLKPAFPVETI